ncbi:MAG: hypothetical protein ACFE8N_04515 [Promethearchaeota archaeon]
MPLYHEIFSEVLKKISPTNAEITLIDSISERLKNLLSTNAQKLNIKYVVIEPQGSTGIKQTQLKDDFDIDLFIGLDYKEYEPNFKNLSKNKLKKASKKDFLDLCNNWIIPSLSLGEFRNPRLLYAEHPYVTVDYYQEKIKIKIDIVLYFHLDLEFIKEKGPITAVDRSPWHGRFVKENLSDDQKNDVRLLKQFFKANHSYGDKSSVGKVGFIGYSAELLIYYFGDLLNLFKNFNNLPSNPLDLYNRDKKTLQKITHFQNDYLLIIDPIDKNRNVASAISERAYFYCNHRISQFLKNPSIDFFEIKPILGIEIEKLEQSLSSRLFIVELQSLDEEIHYTINRDKLYSLGENIVVNGEKEFTHAVRFEKILFELYFEDDRHEYSIAFYCEKPNIPQTYFRRGPPIKESFHANNFKNKNPNYFEKNGYLWVETQREFTNFLDFLKQFINQKAPENFNVLNISNCTNSKLSSGKKALKILEDMIIPFYI